MREAYTLNLLTAFWCPLLGNNSSLLKANMGNGGITSIGDIDLIAEGQSYIQWKRVRRIRDSSARGGREEDPKFRKSASMLTSGITPGRSAGSTR